LAKGIGIKEVKEDSVVFANGKGDRYIIRIVNGDGVEVSIDDDTISPTYGILVNTKTIRASYNFDNKKSVSYIIRKI
jgi:hypothetical protein